MTKYQNVFIFLLRIALGWLFFWAGITKVINPAWSAEGYLKGAKTFTGFYGWLTQSSMLPVVNFINEWGLVLLGISLILGIGVRLSSLLGTLLMILYYIPILQFPYPNPHSFLVDEHIIYALLLLYLAAIQAGRAWGLEVWCSRLPLCSKFPKLRDLLG